MQINVNHSLKPYNTFGIDQKAERFIAVHSVEELVSYVKHNGAPNLLLGGGSNMLLTQDVSGDVIHMDIKGRRILKEEEGRVTLALGAGENWHETVLWTIENGWGGLENLSLIPGNCGTAPVQNIGAYGVEVKDVLVAVHTVSLEDGTVKTYTADQCGFGYRESIFKTDLKGKVAITGIELELTTAAHKLNTGYGAIEQALEEAGVESPTPADISAAVIQIRQSKLPDPAKIGNSGSFFKNPVVAEQLANTLLEQFPEMPSYPNENGVKLAAGWLIEQAGWKGYKKGDAGVHKNQALVLVNYGNASGSELLALAHSIIASVHEKFGVELTPEVNII